MYKYIYFLISLAKLGKFVILYEDILSITTFYNKTLSRKPEMCTMYNENFTINSFVVSIIKDIFGQAIFQ